MLILGVDPGLNITGLGLIEYSKAGFSLVSAGYIRTSAKQPLSKRLEKIYSGLSKTIDQKKPDVLVLEKLYVHYRHTTTAFLLGHARGVISLVAALKNIKLQEYPVTRINKAVLGRGNASKEQVQRMIQSIFNLKNAPEPQDIADALALAVAHAYISNKDTIYGMRSMT